MKTMFLVILTVLIVKAATVFSFGFMDADQINNILNVNGSRSISLL